MATSMSFIGLLKLLEVDGMLSTATMTSDVAAKRQTNRRSETQTEASLATISVNDVNVDSSDESTQDNNNDAAAAAATRQHSGKDAGPTD